MTTREKILYEALSMFSVNGYDAVTIREIASAVGIKESSIYNHFKNKQDIPVFVKLVVALILLYILDIPRFAIDIEPLPT